MRSARAGGRLRGAEPRGIVPRRLARLVPAVLLSLVAGGLLPATPAQASGAPTADAEAGLVSRIAQERSARGLAQLAGAGDLQVVARRHAQRMADRGEPYHNPALGSEVQGWEVVSENVGAGMSVQQIHDAFMGSRTHRDVILSAEHSEVGVGVVGTSDGQIWVVEVFRRPAAAAAAPAPVAAASVQAPVAAPAPLPRTEAPVAPPGPTAASTSSASVPLTMSALTLRAPGPAVAVARHVARRAPAAPVPATDDGVPTVGWVAASLLAAVVALQALVLRRLGLVR